MDLKRDGYVSVWFGNFDSESEFEAYIFEEYGKGGDLPLSKFAEDSGIGWYDHDFREAEFSQQGVVSVRKLLLGTSSSNSFIDNVIAKAKEKDIEEANSFFLLFDFDYSNFSENNIGKLRFACAVPYDKSALIATS